MSEEDVLLKIYIGQNIRDEGILQSEIREKEEIKGLLSKGLIKESSFYRLHLFLTTERGAEFASKLLRKRLEERRDELKENFKDIPKRAFTFIIKTPSYRDFVYLTAKPAFEGTTATDRIMADSRIWILRDKIFTTLENMGFCVKTWSYVSTRGGELGEEYYVISREIYEFLLNNFGVIDFTSEEKDILRLYSFLRFVAPILQFTDIDFIRVRFYKLLNEYSLTENEVAAFIEETAKKGLTSEYRGLLSKGKPFDIKNIPKFNIYLDEVIIKPAINHLLEKGGEIKKYKPKKKFPPLSETKAQLGIPDIIDLGSFYIMISNFERELRDFIKSKLGKSWLKRLRKEFPEMVKKWENLKMIDEKLGIEPEKDLINYANCDDYIQIIRKFKRMFTDNDEELGIVIAQLRIWYTQGRNPLMHARTLNMQKILTTKSAIEYLQKWMKRKR